MDQEQEQSIAERQLDAVPVSESFWIEHSTTPTTTEPSVMSDVDDDDEEARWHSRLIDSTTKSVCSYGLIVSKSVKCEEE